MTVLSNLEPFKVDGRKDLTVSSWLEGNTLLRPEIFQNRWRTDKDPTKELTQYAAIVKQPLARSGAGDCEPQAVLESDLETQFSNDMLALKGLDPIPRHLALRQLRPILGRFSSTVAKHVLDARIMKTCQGRGAGRSDASVIALKAPKQYEKKLRYPLTGAGASALNPQPLAIACGKGYGRKGITPKRPGNNRHIPADQQWTCQICQTSVKDCADSIKQHKATASHMKLAATKYYCEACDIYCDNTPDAIKGHTDSFDHGHQCRMGADMQRDGPQCAEKRRSENGGQVQGTRVTRKKPNTTQ